MISHDRDHIAIKQRENSLLPPPRAGADREARREAHQSSNEQEGNVVRVRYRLGCVMNFTFTQQAP